MPSDAGAPPDGGWKTSCAANAEPLYDLTKYFAGVDACAPYSIQVERVTPIPDTDDNPVQSINQAVQAEIVKANPSSVFQYYQLVDAMWFTTQTTDPMKGGAATPLSVDGLQPATDTLFANTTLETYLQYPDAGRPNCLSCHAYAPIAGDGGHCEGGLCAADFSFVFIAAH
jgi:hypothetical protein